MARANRVRAAGWGGLAVCLHGAVVWWLDDEWVQAPLALAALAMAARAGVLWRR